jgi:ABC-type lipoprotein export system ATPase subunit
VRQGELVALQGPSGSGKSTLLNLCGLLSEPDEGRVQLDGADVTGWSMRAQTLARREKIGFVFQSFNLVPVMSVFENIEYPCCCPAWTGPSARERVERMLARLGLEQLGGAVRTKSLAASASAWPSGARSSSARAWWSPMNRRPIWTARQPRRSSISCTRRSSRTEQVS